MSHPEEWDENLSFKIQVWFGSCELQPEIVFFRDSDEPF